MSGAVFLAAMLPLMLWPMDAANAQCVGFPVQTNQTCTNGGTLADTSIRGIGNVGLQDLGTLSLTNTAAGVISSSGFSSLGIFANSGFEPDEFRKCRCRGCCQQRRCGGTGCHH
ncbi:hypothetical protein ACVWW4_007575 [Bradyrhizobium sp. LB7.1]